MNEVIEKDGRGDQRLMVVNLKAIKALSGRIGGI
jgi:hypothetical protein